MAKLAKRIGALPTSSSRLPGSAWARTVTATAARRPCSVSLPFARWARALTATGADSVKRAVG